MTTKPTSHLDWTVGNPAFATETIEPSPSEKEAGYVPDQKPDPRFMNWNLYNTDQWIKYLAERGIPVWDATTTYVAGSLVQDGTGLLYKSLVSSNLNNALSDYTKWSTNVLADGAVYPTNLKNNFQPFLAGHATNSWTIRRNVVDDGIAFSSIAHSPTLKLFVAAGNFGTGSHYIVSSPDGITWTLRTPSPSNAPIGAMVWASNPAIFIALNSNASTGQWSSDGITWNTATGSFASGTRLGLAWSNELTIAVAIGTGNNISTSTDGKAWSSHSAAMPASGWTSVCWSKEKKLFVAVGAGGNMAYSTTGLTFTAAGTAQAGAWNSVKYASSLELFVAVGDAGAVATSPDGSVWTLRTAAAANNWKALEWSSSLGVLAAVCQTSGQAIMESVDGINWYLKATDPTDTATWVAICFGGSGSNMFVACASAKGVVGGTIMTSFYRDGTMSLSGWRNLLRLTGSFTAGKVAANYAFGQGDPVAVDGTGVAQPITCFYIDSKDYPSVNGLPPRFRVTLDFMRNATSPLGSFTAALFPVTAGVGTAGIVTYTVGTKVVGSDALMPNPLTSGTRVAGADFDLPANGMYCLIVTNSVTLQAASHSHITASLDVKNA